jgi:hypothetical protein
MIVKNHKPPLGVADYELHETEKIHSAGGSTGKSKYTRNVHRPQPHRIQRFQLFKASH